MGVSLWRILLLAGVACLIAGVSLSFGDGDLDKKLYAVGAVLIVIGEIGHRRHIAGDRTKSR
jgi:type IV secretory pathway VirB2 component (pilin)